MAFQWRYNPAPAWKNLYLYFFQSKYIRNSIPLASPRGYKYHKTGTFIDDLSGIKDSNRFFKSFLTYTSGNLNWKWSLNLCRFSWLSFPDITIKDGIFMYKLFNRGNVFPIFIVRMPHHSNNLPRSTFYSLLYSELWQSARCALIFSDFAPKVPDLYSRLFLPGDNARQLQIMLKRCFKNIQMVY